MDSSPSSDAKKVVEGLAELSKVRSYGLMVVVLLVLLLITLFSRDVWVRGIGFVCTLGATGVICWRWYKYGPESERASPLMFLGNNAIQFQGFDPSMSDATVNALVQLISVSRQPLPTPTGVVEGLASDPNSIRALPDSRRLELENAGVIVSPVPSLSRDQGAAASVNNA